MLMLLVYVVLPLLIAYYIFERRPRNFPPGPATIPFFGNILSLAPAPYFRMPQYVKEYGPIVGVKFASEWTVVIHGADLIKEAFAEPAFSGRVFREGLKYLGGDNDGIVQSEGDLWMEQRRFALRHLRDFGFGKNSMEDMISEEVKDVVDWLKKQNGKTIELQRRFSLAVVNSLWRILSGERYDHDDEKLISILEQLERSASALFGFSASMKSLLVFFYPSVAKFFPNWSGWNKIVATAEPRMRFFDKIIKEHKDTQTDEHARDFIDAFLKEAKNSPGSKQFDDHALKSIMSDFFVAGSDTTSVTLAWTMLYLLHNKNVQEKLQEELDRVVGRSRFATLSDRKSLPYTEAVILEVLRSSSIAHMTLPHRALTDSTFHGFAIPKGTMMFGNLHHLHHDPKHWGDPEVFRPERFLSPDGTFVTKQEHLMPFSSGRRVCPGESLARDTIFLFTTALAQNFTITYESEATKPSLEVLFGQLVLTPLHRCNVVMKERN